MARIKCAYPGCARTTAKYVMRWKDSQGKEQCGPVCAVHDKILLTHWLEERKHLIESGNMSLDQAID